MHRFLIATLLLAPVSAFAAAPCKYHAPRNMQIALAGVQAVQIDVHSHNLHLNATDLEQKLTVTGHACTSDNAVIDSLQVTQKRVGNQLQIDIGGERQAPSNLFGSSYAYLDINMQLPAGMPVALRVGSGNATVNGVRQLQSQVNAGDLHVRHVAGKFSASLGAGDIDASDVGSLELSSVGSGDIKIEGIKGDVKIGSIGSGDVLLRRVGGSVHADTLGSGDLNVKDVEGSFSLGAMGSGDVTHSRVKGKLSLPRDDD
jgi:hypothetical protein